MQSAFHFEGILGPLRNRGEQYKARLFHPRRTASITGEAASRGARAGARILIPGFVLVTALLPSVSSAQWNQLGSDIDGELPGVQSGHSIAVSSDGFHVAIGAPWNDGAGSNSGVVRVYRWFSPNWVRVGSDIDGEAAGDGSGYSVALSSDGSRVAIGAPYNDGNGGESGHVRVYQWVGAAGNWVQVGPDIDGEAGGDESGRSVALSSDGSRVAIGAPWNCDNGDYSGHVRVYSWFSWTSSWLHVGQDIDGEWAGDASGRSVALSSDGSRVAIGAPWNDGNGNAAGHVRVYRWFSPNWFRDGSDIDGEAEGDLSGHSVALSSDGSRVAIGATENGGNGDYSGHVRVYSWLSWTSSWLHVDPDIDGEAAGDGSGYSVALSSDGSRVAIGAPYNDGHGAGSGHVRVYSTEIFVFVDGFESGDTSAWSNTVP